jgi:LPPG:FO 2-phospho-L-lactate transferase
LPVTNDPIATIVQTAEEGDLAFQEYFVRRQCQPVVTGFHFNGAAKAEPAPGVLDLIEAADVVVICPSNPWVSIAPILAVPGIRDAIAEKPVVAVSPLVGGAAIKGPAAKMYAELGVQPSAVAVAETYQDLLSGFVLDEVDQDEAGEIEGWGIICLVTDTVMTSTGDRERLAEEVIQFCELVLRRETI